MIRHCVMLRLRPDHDPSDLGDVIHGPGDVADRLPGCNNFVFGQTATSRQNLQTAPMASHWISTAPPT